MPIKCNADWERRFQRVTRKKKNKYDAKETAEIEQRIERLKKIASNTRENAVLEDNSFSRFFYDQKFAQGLGQITEIGSDFNWNKVDEFFANKLGEYKKFFGLNPDELTDVGKVRRDILTMKRLAGGMIDEFARYKGMHQVKKLTGEIKSTLKGLGVNDLDLQNELILDAIEVGSFPRLKTTIGIHQQGEAVLKQQYVDYVDDLKTLGMSNEQIDNILDNSYAIYEVMDETRLISNALGLNVGNVEGIGYFSRNFTKDTSRWIDKANELNKFLPKEYEPHGFQLANSHAKGRSTFKFIPEDELVAAYQLGIEVNDLRALLSEGLLQEYLHAKVDPALLDNMVDMGTLSKLPMTTKEVHNYIVSQYSDLPFKGLADVFVTDPVKAYDDYVEQLRRGVEESAIAKTILSEGVEAGWAIPKSQFRAIADTDPIYNDFVELTQNEINNFYPGYEGGGMYVHRVVKDTTNAILEISGNPAYLGTLAQNIQYWGGFLAKSVLISPAYAMRILYDGVIASSAAGNNMLRLIEAGTDLMKLSVGGLNVLDDIAKVYKGVGGENISERRLFQEFIRHRGNQFIPFAPNMRVGTPFQNVKSFDPKRMMSYFAKYMQAFGVREGLSLGVDSVKRFQDEIFSPIAYVATFFENMAKWSTVKSLADTRTGMNTVAQFISGLGSRARNFDNLKDIFNHVDDYFFAWDDIGTWTGFTSSLIRPFAIFSMKNPPAQIRQAMRNPRQFINYWRIRSFINQRTEDDEKLIDAGVQDWVSRSAPLFLDKDEQTGHWYTLLTSNFDARAEAWRWLDSVDKSIHRFLFGDGYIGTTHDRLSYLEDERKGKNGITKFFTDGAKNLLPIWKESISLLSGIDVDTGYAIQRNPLKSSRTFLGLNMSPAAKWVLSIYPPIEKIDRANPGGIFGTPEIRDPITNEVIFEGTPSIFGNKSVSLKLEKYSPEVRTGMISILGHLGFSIKVVDVARNTQYTFTRMVNLVDKMESDLKNARKELSAEIASGDSKKYPTDFNRRKEEYHKTLRQWAHLRAETIMLGQWMHNNNIPPKEVWDRLEQEAVKTIPDLITDEKEFNDIMNEVLTDYGDLHLDGEG